MKQALGIAKQVKLMEAIDKKLNVLLEATVGKDKAAVLIAEFDVPVNPARQREEQQQEVEPVEVVEAAPTEAAPKSNTRKQAEAMKAGRK